MRGENYGPEQTPDQVGTGRFITFTAGIDGLFLAGAGIMGGGLMAWNLAFERRVRRKPI